MKKKSLQKNELLPVSLKIMDLEKPRMLIKVTTCCLQYIWLISLPFILVRNGINTSSLTFKTTQTVTLTLFFSTLSVRGHDLPATCV